MPKMSERERLADLETRRLKLNDDIETARRALRSRYANIVADHAVETMSEREFREVVIQAIKLGAPAAIAAMKTPSNTASIRRVAPAASTAEPRAAGGDQPG